MQSMVAWNSAMHCDLDSGDMRLALHQVPEYFVDYTCNSIYMGNWASNKGDTHTRTTKQKYYKGRLSWQTPPTH